MRSLYLIGRTDVPDQVQSADDASNKFQSFLFKSADESKKRFYEILGSNSYLGYSRTEYGKLHALFHDLSKTDTAAGGK